MPSIENEPLEVRKAYSISELLKLVDQAATIEEAKELCKGKLIELVEKGVVRSANEDVEEIREAVKEKIKEKFGEAEDKKRGKKFFDEAEKLRKAGRDQEAVDFYQKAIEFDAEEASYFNNLGVSLFNLGKYKDADYIFQKALALNFKKTVDQLPTLWEVYEKCKGVWVGLVELTERKPPTKKRKR